MGVLLYCVLHCYERWGSQLLGRHSFGFACTILVDFSNGILIVSCFVLVPKPYPVWVLKSFKDIF